MRHFFYSILFFLLFCLINTSYVLGISSTTSNSGHFSRSYQAQKENSEKYYEDAIVDFTKKLNIAIKNHNELQVLYQSCGGCDVVQTSFDDYLKSQLPRKDYGAAVVRYFHPSISKTLSHQTQKSLNDLIAGMLTDIIDDADYLIQTHHDITTPGSYTDGDLSNSSYDLMDDMQKILKLFLKEPHQYDGFVNTMQNDAGGLITGRFETGQWAQGEEYEIDLASDLAAALGQSQDGESSDTDDNGDDCEDGFCITLDIISNDSYSSGGRGTGFVNTNFEEIFGSALDWLVKKGDKRNIACKAPPPVNHFQSNNDQNLSLKNIFRGLGIFLFQKTPKYAQSDNGTEEERTPDQQERDTDAIIADSFKNYNIDPDNLMLYTQRQMVEKATPIASRAGDSVLNQKRADDILEQRQDIQRRSLVSTRRNEAGNTDTGTKNMFRSFASWVQSFNTLGEDAKIAVTKANNMENCGN